MRRSFPLVLALLALLAPRAFAELRLPSIFGPHMVLQRDAADRVWGWDAPGTVVTVEIAGQKKSAKAGADGRWTVVLDPLRAEGKPLSMRVSGSSVKEFADVLVGEVWLCSGQSNMQWTVANSCDPDLETVAPRRIPGLRLITVPQVGTQEPQDDFEGQWAEATSETVPEFSGVGFFFGRLLHQILEVPVGLIDNAWGGSSAEAWVRRDLLEKDPAYAELMDGWKKIEATYRHENALALHRKAVEAWKARAAQAKAAGMPTPLPPRAPTDQLKGQHRPGNLYCGILNPIIGFGLRGAIWYQGESNASRASQYRDLFPLMIRNWREQWKIGEFPFYWVQLADFKAETPDPAESDWAELREAQTLTLKRLPNTGQAVIIDLGEAQDIHPKNKRDVAERLARWALARDYGMSIPFRSPEFKEMRPAGPGRLRLTFDFAGAGLRTFDVPEVRGFALCGADRRFVWAQAKIVGPDAVEVWKEAVREPVAVRYAWADNPVCNLMTKDGLPVTPFRTDDFPMVTEGVGTR